MQNYRTRNYQAKHSDLHKGHLARIWQAFDRDALAQVCAMHETEFAEAYGFERHAVDQPAPDDFFLFRPGHQPGDSYTPSPILAVAHLDTVARDTAHERRAQFLETEGGTVVYSRALDDRLGAYIILELLPKLGLHFDVLLTVGEENGRSTAQFFDGPLDHTYNWGIEFDRGGTDVVCYQYEDPDLVDLIEATGAIVAEGIFSDISFLDHLKIKCANWGVGYQDYHGPKSHAWLDDTFEMLAYFLDFHETNKDTVMPYVPSKHDSWWSSYRRPSLYNDPMWEEDCGADDGDCDGEVEDDPIYGPLCKFHIELIRG